MDLHIRPSRVKGSFSVPGSKSHTIRGIVAGLLAEGESTLHAPLVSQDTLSVLRAAERLGAAVERDERERFWRIGGTGGELKLPESPLDLGNSGTGLRILTAVAALADGRIAFDGDGSLRTRGMAGLLKALESLGARCESTGGRAPLAVTGPIHGGSTTVDGTGSQFLTALLMTLPLLKEPSQLDLDFLNEEAYVRITLNWLERCGIDGVKVTEDRLHYTVPGGRRYRAFERVIPADFSTAAFPLAAGLIAGEGVEILNLDFDDLQGDKRVFDFLAEAGGRIERAPSRVAVYPSSLRGRTFDLNGTPDALPIMAVLGAFAEGETRLVNAAQARLKETDRIRCMTEQLARMGADVEELPDGMVIRGGSGLHGARLSGCGDHRIVMSLAVAALAAEGASVIEGAEDAGVTWPEFIPSFLRCGAEFFLSSGSSEEGERH